MAWIIKLDGNVAYRSNVEPRVEEGYVEAEGFNYTGPLEIKVEQEVERVRVLNPVEFFSQFTPAEEVAIRDFAADRPDGEPEQVTAARKQLGVLLGRLDKTERINLDFPPVVEGMASLVQLGLITQERADEVLSGMEPV